MDFTEWYGMKHGTTIIRKNKQGLDIFDLAFGEIVSLNFDALPGQKCTWSIQVSWTNNGEFREPRQWRSTLSMIQM